MKRIISLLLFSIITMIGAVSLNAAFYVIKDGRVVNPNTVLANAKPGDTFTFQVLTTIDNTILDDDGLLFGVDGTTPTLPPANLGSAGMHNIIVEVPDDANAVQVVVIREPGQPDVEYYVQVEQKPVGYLLCPTQNVTLDPSGSINVNGATTLVVTSGSVALTEGTVLGSANGVTITYTGTDQTVTPASGATVINVKVTTVNATPGAVINVALDKIEGITSQCTFNVTIKTPQPAGYFLCPTTPVTLDSNTSTVVNNAADLIITSGSVSLLEGMLLGSNNGINITYTGNPLTVTPTNSPQKISVRVTATAAAPIGTVVNVLLDKVTGVTSQCAFNVTVTQPQTVGTISCPTQTVTLDPNTSTTVNGAVDLSVTSGSVSLLEGMILGSSNGINIAYTGSPLTVSTANSPQKINVRVTATAAAPQGVTIPIQLNIGGLTSTCAFNVTVTQPPTVGTISCPTQTVSLDPNTSTVVNGAVDLSLTSGSVSLLEGMILGSSNGINIAYTGNPLTLTPANSPQKINVRVTATAAAPQGVVIPVQLNIGGLTSTCAFNVTVKPQIPAYFLCPTTDITLDPNTYTHSTAQIVVTSGSVTLTHAQLIGQKDGININYPGPDLTITPSNSPQTITVSISAMPNAVPGNVVSVPLDKVPGVSSQCTFNVLVKGPIPTVGTISCPTQTVNLQPNTSTIVNSAVNISLTSGSLALVEGMSLGSNNGINITYTGNPLTVTASNSPQAISVRVTATATAPQGVTIPVQLNVGGLISTCAFNVTVNATTSAYFSCPTTSITLEPNSYTNSTTQLVVTSGSVTLRNAQLIGSSNNININYTGPDLTVTPSNSPQTIPVSISSLTGAPEGVVINVPLSLVGGVSSQCAFNVTVNKKVVPPPPLGVDDLPNCYIVDLNTKEFTFPVEKAYLAWEKQKHLSVLPKPTGTPSANAVWTNVKDGVLTMKAYQQPDVSVSSTPGFTPRQESITLRLRGNIEGSVIIEYKVGTTVMWSWHIWVTNYKPTGSFFDRNIGAKGDLRDTKNMENRGFYYQWGRSTPFPGPTYSSTASSIDALRLMGPAYKAASPQSIFDFPGTYVGNSYVSDFTNSTIKHSVSNHSQFLLATGDRTTAENATEGDWYSNKVGVYDNELWGGGSSSNGSNKGLFDPCPTGWRVPTSTELSYMFPASSTDFPAGGIALSPNPSYAALPATGYFSGLQAALSIHYIPDLIALWTVSKFEAATPTSLHKYVHASNYITQRRTNSGGTPGRSALNCGHRSFAMPVRCVKK